MTEPSSADLPRTLRTAFVLGAALLLGFGAMYLFTVGNNSRRRVLETVSEPSAIGDERLFPLTEKLTKDQQIGTYGKRSLVVAETELDSLRDSRMEKIGLDDTVSFYIYRSTSPEKGDFYFLKATTGKYIRCLAK